MEAARAWWGVSAIEMRHAFPIATAVCTKDRGEVEVDSMGGHVGDGDGEEARGGPQFEHQFEVQTYLLRA